MTDFVLPNDLRDDLRFIGITIEDALGSKADKHFRGADVALSNFREDLSKAWSDLVYPTGASQGVPFGVKEVRLFLFAHAKMVYHALVLETLVATYAKKENPRIEMDAVFSRKIVETTNRVAGFLRQKLDERTKSGGDVTQ